MPSYDFTNVEDFVAFLQANKHRVASVLGPQPTEPEKNKKPEDNVDALGQRDVTAQARQAATHAPTTTAGPSMVPKKPTLLSGLGSAEARNTLRLTNGLDDPFRDVTHFGRNTTIPDFTMHHELIDSANSIICANKRFFDQSSFFHPHWAHIYIGVLEIVLTMRSQRAIGRLEYRADQFLTWFDNRFGLETLPVPGFSRQILADLGSSSPAIANYENVSPFLPDVTQANRGSLGVFRSLTNGNNFASRFTARIVPVRLLVDQMVRFYTAAQNAVNDPNNNNPARTISNYAHFMRTIFEADPDSNNNTVFAAAPTSSHQRTQLSAAGQLLTRITHMMAAPGVRQVFWCPIPIAQTLSSYTQQILSAMPSTASLRADPQSGDFWSWQEYLALDSRTEWFDMLINVMTLYCEFWADSCTVGEIPESGASALQVEFTRAVSNPVPTTRYPDIDYTVNGELRNAGVPPADRMDASVECLNSNLLFPIGNRTVRQGPYWTNLALAKRAPRLTPTVGYARVLIDKYRKSNTSN
ncbi:coat protein [Rhizoctonia oryzae-sativae partitivirus 6]|nr:coat protein [Rhizoctonia oryzae-sativae partitivirus 6]